MSTTHHTDPVLRDSVLTVAIGRNLFNGAPMSAESWADFRASARELADAAGLVVFAGTTDDAVCSDGTNDGTAEDSFALIVVNVADLDLLRLRLARLLRRFGQHSACFAHDAIHEPVFSATRSGFRPGSLEDADGLGAVLASGAGRRTQSHA